MNRNIDLYWWLAYYSKQMELICKEYLFKRQLSSPSDESNLQEINEKLYKAIQNRNNIKNIILNLEEDETV